MDYGEFEEYRGYPLCSECAMIEFFDDGTKPKLIKGKWHDKFDKKAATLEQIRKSDRYNMIK